MVSVVTITIIVLCTVAILGVLMGLQQIITYQAQIALEEYDGTHEVQQESDSVVLPEMKSYSKSLAQNCSGKAKCISENITKIVDGDTYIQ